MSVIGATLQVLLGANVPAPASMAIVSSLRSVKVVHSDEGRSAFELVVGAGRSPTRGLLDYDIFQDPAVRPFSRVILIVTLAGLPQVLMDGVITNVQLNPSNTPGATTVTLTGEDLSVLMDLQEKNAEYPNLSPSDQVTAILGGYAGYGIVPDVRTPTTQTTTASTEAVPSQQATDLAHIQALAEQVGHVFYVSAGPLPNQSRAYWGPADRSTPQKALSYNMGTFSNVDSMDIQFDGLATLLVTGQVQDRSTNQVMPIQTTGSLTAPLASQSAVTAFPGFVRTQTLRESGLGATDALARAQGRTDASSQNTVTINGELDAGRYGAILQSRGLVGVRGLGATYDGNFYVKTVTHTIGRGSYRQSFTLTREGIGSTAASVNA